MTAGKRTQRPPLPAKHRITWALALVVLAALFYKAGADTEFSLQALVHGLPEAGKLLKDMTPPNWAYLSKVWKPLAETVQMAIAGTTFGSLLALPMMLLSARNITRTPLLLYPARFLMNLVRTMPDVLLAAVFVAVLGIGTFPGVVAIALFSFGIVTKFASETIEAIDPGPLEALTAVGANRIQSIAFAVIPQVIPQLMSYVVYVFEINIRAAAVVGLVGAGGIGNQLQVTMGLWRYRDTALLIIVIFLIVFILDQFSTWLRGRLV